MQNSLRHYWRNHLAVILGAAVATAVLTGALLVGDSVRHSLQSLMLDRLGEIDSLALVQRPVRQALAEELAADAGAETIVAPVLFLPATALADGTGARANSVSILGVDAEFSALYPQATALDFARRDGQVFPSVVVNSALAGELGVAVGDDLLLNFQRPSDVPRETLVGRRDDVEAIETLRLTLSAIVPDRGFGGFALDSRQSRPLNAFVEIERLQRSLFGRRGEPKINALLADGLSAEAMKERLAERVDLDDLGLRLRPGNEIGDGPVDPTEPPAHEAIVVESRELVLSERWVEAISQTAETVGAEARPVLTYLANTTRRPGEPAGSDQDEGDPGASYPYSTVAGLDSLTGLTVEQGASELVAGDRPLGNDEILLSRWAADDLGAQIGDTIVLTYYAVGDRDELNEVDSTFTLAGIVAMAGLAVDRSLTPEFPGLSDAEDMAGWQPSFPVDLDRIRPIDEDYWDLYRAVPKALISLDRARELWTSRFGDTTSLRLTPGPPRSASESDSANRIDTLRSDLESELRLALAPDEAGFMIRPIREEGLQAAQGATDFGGLFIGFSLFLIAAAALLVALLFRLGVEQRAREIGLLRALGFSQRAVQRRFLREGLLLAVVGTILGLGGAVGYAGLMLAGLRTWWLPAVGEPVLFLHVAPRTLILGGVISIVVVAVTLVLSLRRLRRLEAVQLLSGVTEPTLRPQADARPASGRRSVRKFGKGVVVAAIAGSLALVLFVVSMLADAASAPALAFATGFLVLVAGLGAFSAWLRPVAGRHADEPRKANAFGSSASLVMGARSSARNPGRSLLCAGLVAAASFVIVAVGANRGHGDVDVMQRTSGAGGFTLVAESDVPIVADLDRPEVREEFGLTSGGLEIAEVIPFRLLPGDDASCLNLYRPQRPRVLGVPAAMIERGGFDFQQVLPTQDRSDAETRENDPWSLLDQRIDPVDGEIVIPAIADYNSALWILHSGLGQDVEIEDEAGRTIRLRLVGLLRKSLFQSELLIAEERFVEHFPSRAGSSYFLVETAADEIDDAATALEAGLGRFGFDATPTAEKLAAFQAVESTYLSTFQTLGGLGLLLGTFGLGVVLLRNVLERRGELATLRAFGFRRRRLAGLVVAENAFLLAVGLGLGAVAGLVAVAPNLLTRGSHVPWLSLAATLAAVFVVGLLASLAAVRGTLKIPLAPVLKEG